MSKAPEPSRKAWLSAAEAVQLLGVRHQTLYAYVSRGLVRSVQGATARTRLYARDDLERVHLKSRARSRPEAMAATLLDRGHPVVPTSITEITADGPSYRGRLAVLLAKQQVSFEQVAELLWTGMWHDVPLRWPTVTRAQGIASLLKGFGSASARHQLPELFALVVMHLAMGRGPVQERLVSGRPLEAGREMVQVLTGCFGFLRERGRYVAPRPGRSVAESVLCALGRPLDAQDVQLLDAALVLLADHELSPGTFAARVAASAGCSVHSCVAAAILASSGAEVALRYERIENLLEQAGGTRGLLTRARHLLRSGLALPGFEHPLYPAGDPRAAYLLQVLRARRRAVGRVAEILVLVQAMAKEFDVHPRHELAVVAVCRALGLPRGTAVALFTLARIAGWEAHVLEQRLSSTMIRPRARFIPGAAGAAL